MKRLLTIAAFIILVQSVPAAPRFRADSSKVTPNQANNGVAKKDTNMVPVIAPPVSPYQNVLCKRQLDSITKDVPLDYNEYVQAYIDNYARRRDEMAHILGLTKYYFPIYEKAFREAGIPEEIKYLSIVESELNPNAVSRVGATGPWQFMSATAKLYGLNMDGYVDERRDPIQASYAAAAYLKDAYQQFGDWLLAIASYNCGKSNVIRAIEKAGATDFWSIRPYLPVETRGYVPAYIAISYVMSYHKTLGIGQQDCNFSVQTDTLMVNHPVMLDNLSKALNVDMRELLILNPSYTRAVINGSANAPKRLVIPQLHSFQYATLYDALNSDTPVSLNNLSYASFVAPASAESHEPRFHKVRKGETLAGIADRYGITVHELKIWNHLSGNKAVPGSKLKIKADAEEQASVRPRRHVSRG